MAGVPPHFYQQSGVIASRKDRGREEVLLISSRGGKRWVIPKGVVEEDLTPAESALNEAWEEGGVRGRLSPEEPVGTYRYRKWGGTCTVQVFAMEVSAIDDNWPERESRARRWLSRTEAAQEVREEGLREIILGRRERQG